MNERTRAAVALVLVQLFFGIHYFAAKIVLHEIPPRSWAVLRAACAAALLVLWARLSRRPPRLARRDYGRLALFSVFGVVINQWLFVEGLSRTTAVHASILITGIPVGTLLFAVLLRREALTAAKVVALALATGGVLLVVLRPAAATAAGGGPTLIGDLMILGNALSYAFFLVISKRILERVAPLQATAVLLTFGSMLLFVLGWTDLRRFDPTVVSTPIWLWAGFIVVVPTALGYLLNYWALSRVNPSMVALFIYLQPVIATGLSVALLREPLGPWAVVGALLVFAGVQLALRSGDGRGPRARPSAPS